MAGGWYYYFLGSLGRFHYSLLFTARYANIVLKKADIPLSKRAGELTEEDTEKLITIMQVNRLQPTTMVVASFVPSQNPRQYKIPDWFLNRQRDIKDGKTNQVGTST